MTAHLPRFLPVPWLPGKHLQTIVPAFLPTPQPSGEQRTHDVAIDSDTTLRLAIHEPGSAARGTVLLLHGLGGSIDSPYMKLTATEALARDSVVVRMNMRGCGGTAHLTRSLANAGRSDDVGAVLAELGRLGLPRPFALAGFSLGGNIVLRYAGRAGDACAADAVAAINPPIELDTCATALERRFFYNKFYTLSLCRRLREIREHRPMPGPDPTLATVRTVRGFDDLYTAPDGGYPSAAAYYADASSASVLSPIRVPTLVVSAADDPIIPVRMFARYHDVRPADLHFLHPPSGGHVGYRQWRQPRFWAGSAALDFLDRALGLERPVAARP